MGDLLLVADLLLQPLQKFCGGDAVHLGVVELKGHRQGGAQPLLPVLAPDEEGVVVAPGVDIHRAVDLVPRQGRGADDHILLAQLKAFPALTDLSGELSIILRKLLQISGNGNVTPTSVSPFLPGRLLRGWPSLLL